jgi:hypothetical protein
MLPTAQLGQSPWAPPSARVGWWVRGASILLFLLLVTTGCAVGPPPQQLRWDLRQSHTKEDVHWQSDLELWSIDHVDVTILLPGTQTFVGQGINVILSACRDQDQVWQVLIYLYPARTIDDAYRQAKQLAQMWHMDTADLEAWYQGVLAGRRHGIKDRDEPFNTGGMGGPPLAPGGPAPSGAIVYSFDEQRPALILFRFEWDETLFTCQT